MSESESAQLFVSCRFAFVSKFPPKLGVMHGHECFFGRVVSEACAALTKRNEEWGTRSLS